nr:uncharacterized protein LOC124809893 isoform X2 [Hydra vulgaris]
MDKLLIRLWCVCTILLPSVSLFIIRLPCSLYASFNFTKSKYYIGDIDSTYSVNSINECGIYCVRSPNCVFANYNENQKICKLMSSKPKFLNSIVDQQWQVLMSETENNSNIGLICEDNTPCKSLYCRDICLSGDPLVNSYICSGTYISFGAPWISAARGNLSLATPSSSSSFLSAALPNINGKDEYQDLLYRLENFVGLYVYFNIECRDYLPNI